MSEKCNIVLFFLYVKTKSKTCDFFLITKIHKKIKKNKHESSKPTTRELSKIKPVFWNLIK